MRVIVYNQQPKPRVLFEDIPEKLFEELSELVPTAKLVAIDEEVHESEFDLLVTMAMKADARSKHLHVLSFGADVVDAVRAPRGLPGKSYIDCYRNFSTLATEASIPSEVDAETRGLLARTVVETLPPGEKFRWSIPGDPQNDRASLLVTLGAEKFPYAFKWRRSTQANSAYSVVLPAETTDHRAWLVWYLRWLHEVDPQTFPGEPDWASSPRWATATTSVLHEKLEEVREEKERLLAELDGKEREAKQYLDAALREDAVGFQRLLTADGDELEHAVHDALVALGFTVEAMDEHHDAVTNAKLEDLRVRDPDESDWLALVEIKGYSKGAKTRDVAQIVGRPMRSYIRETGHDPSAVWHIVNAARGSDPATRGDPIPNDVDLDILADANGVLIDTRQLFLALRDTQLGVVEPSTIRKEIRDSIRRWNRSPI